MHPFNTIPRPALVYNQHDQRLLACSQGDFPTEIWHNVVCQPPVRSASAFRNFSMVNLYSYFACDEERTVHFARLATACIGTGKSADQVYFNLHSVLDLLQDKTRGITPDSRARILGELIDEVVRFGLPKGQRSLRSCSAFYALFKQTDSLPASGQAEIRWRIIRGVEANRMAISDRNDTINTFDARIRHNDPVPLEDQGLVKLAYKLSRFNVWDGGCTHTLDQLNDLINLILTLPQGRKVVLLTALAEKVAKLHSDLGGREASDALIVASSDWPFHERIGVLAPVLGNRGYWDNRDRWQGAIEGLLAEFKSLPLTRKPVAIVHLIELLTSYLDEANTLGPGHYVIPWKLASTLVEQAARLKSVQSSAIVMEKLRKVLEYMFTSFPGKTANVLAQAFSADNAHEARTRARQVLCLRPWGTLLSLIAEGIPLHPKVSMAASLVYRIDKLPYSDRQPCKDQTFDAKLAGEPCAIWTEAKALGSRRCNDIRMMLLEKMPHLPFQNMDVTFETMLQDGRQLSPLLKEKFLHAFTAYSRQENVEARPPQHTIDAFINLVFASPSRPLLAALLELMDALSNKWVKDPATPQLIREVIGKCLQLPPLMMAPMLIELAGSGVFPALECAPLAATLFHRMLEEGAALSDETKGPVLAALAKLISCLEPAVTEAAFADLLRQADALPENTRGAWNLCLRIAAIFRLIRNGDPSAYCMEIDAVARKIDDLKGKSDRNWLMPMLLDRVSFTGNPSNPDFFAQKAAW